MHNRKIKNFLKKTKPDSGFTLTELLTGLIMSIFVTGALGFGLLQILRVTAKETAKTNARNETSRAVEFISDELRRARTIETDTTGARGAAFDTTGRTVVLALNIPEINSSQMVDVDGDGTLKMLGSDNDASTSERVIYYLEDSSGNWQGPQVLYRWGPPLNANGNYTENDWQHEALIDGIDDTLATNPCDASIGEILTTTSAKGFYACLTDDDGDGIVEDGTVDLNGDGVIDDAERADNDRAGKTAQIYLTGGIDTIANNGTENDENYTAQTRAVARSREANVNNAMATATKPIYFRSLEADYVCNPYDRADPNDDEIWTMRTDFDNSSYASGASSTSDRTATDDATKWVHEPGRQAQPINIDSNRDLTIYSLPIESSSCLSTGNSGASRTDDLSDLLATGHSVPHTIQFQATVDNRPGTETNADFYQTFNGNTTDNPDDASNYDNPNVSGDGRVQVFKNGSRIQLGATIPDPDDSSIDSSTNIPAPLYGGYDLDGDGSADRLSLGEFLVLKNYATYDGTDTYTITGLENDERIVAFEVGQIDNGDNVDPDGDGLPHPGFDLQDNVFIMRHEAFGENHSDD